MIKRVLSVLLGLLLLSACAGADDSRLSLSLPRDARQVEDVVFQDGEHVMTWQLSGGARVQLMQFRHAVSLTERMNEWSEPKAVSDLSVSPVDGRPAQGIRFVSTEDGIDYCITLLRISGENETYLFETVFPQRLGDDQIHAMVDSMIRSLHFT